jgi:signal transduction histidine kinase
MSGEDVWELGLGRWEVYFGLVLASTIIYVMAQDGMWPAGAIATVLLLAMVPWYHLAGRRVMGRDAPGLLPYVYVAGSVALSAGAYWAAPESGLVLFALCPQCYMIMRWLPASLAVVLLNLAPAMRFLRDKHSPGSIISFLAWSVITIAFSVIFGLWVERIIKQSIERRDLIEQLEATRSELADVSREAGVMAERERLAAEIHDTLAQGFTSILMLLQAAEPRVATDPDEARRQIGLAARTARENLAEARALVAAA